MRQTWRWFGPIDKVSIADARQAGAQGIVTALHHVSPGETWTSAEIEQRKREVATTATGVASDPVPAVVGTAISGITGPGTMNSP